MSQLLWPLLGLIIATAVPFGWHVQTLRRERTSEDLLAALRRAQTTFQAANGGAFATDLASLQRPCPGRSESAVLAADDVPGYVLSLRATSDGTPAGVDCHGHPTTSDYYAAIAPAPGRSDGRRAYAMTSQGPVFVFFDGIAPTEGDMAAGGLATARGALDTFRIP